MGADLVSSVAARAAPEWGDLCAATRMATRLTDVRLCLTSGRSHPGYVGDPVMRIEGVACRGIFISFASLRVRTYERLFFVLRHSRKPSGRATASHLPSALAWVATIVGFYQWESVVYASCQRQDRVATCARGGDLVVGLRSCRARLSTLVLS